MGVAPKCNHEVFWKLEGPCSNLLLCLELLYYCDGSIQTVQSLWGVIIVFKLLGHT